jgi:protein TonB
VRVVVDEEGKVVKAEAVSGHPLLRDAAVTAARNTRFSPPRVQGQPVKLDGVITYNFELQ